MFLNRLAISIMSHVGEVYLTNDLGYDKANLSSIKVICTPLNILLSAQVGFLSKNNAFRNLFYIGITYIIVASYAILVLMGTFPSSHEEQNSLPVYSHILVVFFLLDMLGEFE